MQRIKRGGDGFIALTILVAAQQFGDIPGAGRVAFGLQDALHGPWFALITWIVYGLTRSWLGTRATLWSTVATVVALAIGTESLQLLTGGDAQWSDVGSDLLGAGAALALIAGRARTLPRVLAWFLALALITVSLTPLLTAVSVQMHRNAIFPDLVRFGAPAQRNLVDLNGPAWVVAPPPGWNRPGGPVLEVELADVTWPGFTLVEPVPDWRNFETLAVEIFVPDASAPLKVNVAIRLKGAPVDQVYRTFVLPAGPHALRIRLRDLFDPAACEVTHVVINSTREFAGRRLYVGRIALEGQAPHFGHGKEFPRIRRAARLWGASISAGPPPEHVQDTGHRPFQTRDAREHLG
jgi:hypothetical protein